MKLLSSLFLEAIALSSASAAPRWRGRQVHGLAARDGARHDAVDEGAARGLADHRQHVRFVGRVDADVAGQEFTRVFERGQGQGGGHLHGGTSLECY
jgi:hypothetical protein